MPIKTIIFDFGNVVAYFDHWQACKALAKLGSCRAEEVCGFCFKNQLEDDLESSRLSSDEFLRRLRERFGLAATDELLARSFSDIFKPNPDVEALLPPLKGRYRLLLGSNTSAL